MDALIAARLDQGKNNKFFDSVFSNRIRSTARQYIDSGMSSLNFYITDFDAASDLVNMWAPVVDAINYGRLERNAALNFRHPMTFTQLHVMTTFVSQILFGGDTARSVDARKDEDQRAVDDINALLAWNDSQLDIYFQGWLWIWASLVYNRGVWFEGNGKDKTVTWEEVEELDFTGEPIPVYKRDGVTPRMRAGKPVTTYPTRTRLRMKRTFSGFKNTVHIVSPYDFICDPQFPVAQFQEGRFAGHRVMIPWNELKRRSLLDPHDDEYVIPSVVEKIKTQKGSSTAPAGLGQTQGMNSSRTYYDRMLRGASTTGMGGIGSGLVPGADGINKQDGGVVECFNITIRQRPRELGMYDDDEAGLINMLITNVADVLSVNVLTNEHDEFPYCIGEGRPSAHRQFTPGWALAVKPCQDRVDDLNMTHSTAQKRMGNILLIDGTKCDVSNLLAPDKNGLMILVTPEGKGTPFDEIVKQIPLKDVTSGYNDEMGMWIETAQNVTGAHPQIQGETEDPSQSATQNDNTQQMATGRMSSIARLLSEMALTKQTRRFVMNFQQYMPDEMIVRIIGKGKDFNPDTPVQKFQTVKRADIQVGFDVVPHDGAMPGANAKIVAAATRAIEAISTNPLLQTVADDTIPGSLDIKEVFIDILEKSGLPVGEFRVTREQAMQNLQAKQLAAGMGVQPIPGADSPPAQTIAAPAPIDASGQPQLPAIPPATPPPTGATLPT